MGSIRIYKGMPPLDEEQLAEIEFLRNMKDEDIDCSDIPALTKEELARFKPARLREKKSVKKAS